MMMSDASPNHPPKVTSTLAPWRVADLDQNGSNAFDIRPDSAALAVLGQQLDLPSLRKLRFDGTLRAIGKKDWQINAHLGASVVQPCVITLAPVSTRIDRDVTRRYLADWVEPTEDDVEMNDDETIDPLGSHIDLMEVMREALALALPQYPRAEGADLEQSNFTKQGHTPMSDEEARPFAGLADLRATMTDNPNDEPDT